MRYRLWHTEIYVPNYAFKCFDGMMGWMYFLMFYGGFMKLLCNSIRFSVFSLFLIMPAAMVAQRPVLDVANYNGDCDEREALKRAIGESLQEEMRVRKMQEEMSKKYNGNYTEDEALQIALNQSSDVPAEYVSYEVIQDPYEQDASAFSGGNVFGEVADPYASDYYEDDYSQPVNNMPAPVYFEKQVPVNSAVPYSNSKACGHNYYYHVDIDESCAKEQADRVHESQMYKKNMQKPVEAKVSMCQKITTALFGTIGAAGAAVFAYCFLR